MNKILNKIYYKSVEKSLSEINSTLAKNLLELKNRKVGIDHTRKISFNKKGIKLTSPYRRHPNTGCRFGRTIAALMYEHNIPNVSGDDIYTLSFEYEFLKAKKGKFLVVTGADIANVYRNALGYKTKITSCMQGGHPSWFNLYTKNPKVSMLIYIVKNELVGRALIWDNNFMDYVYISDNKYYGGFIKYARENNLKFRLSRVCGGKVKLLLPSGEVSREVITLNLNVHFQHFPYLDTIRYVSFAKGTLSTDSSQSEYTLNSEYGAHSGINALNWIRKEGKYILSENQ